MKGIEGYFEVDCVLCSRHTNIVALEQYLDSQISVNERETLTRIGGHTTILACPENQG
jgi:hypothetical protein